jgi:DNA gyrase/topoisomerase IV subunit B
MSENIKKLNDYQHVRLRTEMYLGSRTLHTQTILQFKDQMPIPQEISWVPAIYTAFREIIDNALDEVIGHGYGNKIDISYDENTGIMSVEDNGRGIPIAWDEEHNCHLATLVLTHARAGRNFGERGQVAGTNGIGGSGVNFCSEYFLVDVWRDGQHWQQRFEEDPEGIVLQIKQPKIKKYSKTETGTRIEFKLSRNVFNDTTLPDSFVSSRVFEIALANPNVKFTYNGHRISVKPRWENYLFGDKKPVVIDIEENGFAGKFLIVPDWIESGDHIHSLVNNIPAFNGGVHVEGFKRFFYGNLLDALERESKRRKLTPNRSDVTEGTLLFNITTMKAPNFDSQSKTRLINEEVAKLVQKSLNDETLYKNIIRKNPEWIEAIYKRCAERTMKKDEAELAKLARKVSKIKVPGMLEATGNKRQDCILFLAEGESAIGGMGTVRNPEIHGGMGLRGKVLNVNGVNPKIVLENNELKNIMNAIGLNFGQKAKKENLQYGKIYIAHDMDPDGLNIGALLINFFHTYWPELFQNKDDPFVFIFMTPFIIAEKGKQRKYWYSHNYHEFDPRDYSGWSITRAKGLGTLTPDDWRHSLDNPELFAVLDEGNMQESLDLIFNDQRSDHRKVWIGR